MEQNFQKNFQKHCVDQKRVLYLHPLSERVRRERQEDKFINILDWQRSAPLETVVRTKKRAEYFEYQDIEFPLVVEKYWMPLGILKK